MLFPALTRSAPDATDATVRVADDEIATTQLAAASAAVAAGIEPGTRVAVVVERDLATVVAIVAVLRAGATAIPINPGATDAELDHVLRDSTPALVLHRTGDDLAAPLAGITNDALDVAALLADASPAPGAALDPPVDESPALVMYTSGTTGPPKGVVLSRRAVAANLDALAAAWAVTAADCLVHALPLYHVHGLVLGVLGPLRAGASLHHTGRFDPATTAAALRDGGTMHFGVPTIYARLADAAEADPTIADAMRGARLLVSGSAGLARPVHERIERCCGHVIVERYGMTETMITTAVPAGRRDKVGTVGPALPGVELRLVDETGSDIADGEEMGEIWARTPSMFSGYLNHDDATVAAFRDGWMVTGDIATRDRDGFLRIVGRSSTDIIKSGGFKIGAGEIEDCLLDHPGVAEAAVRGVADDDLGERVVAWVVARPDAALASDDVLRHTAGLLVAHKRPRAIHVVDALPRNAMGKVEKTKLVEPAPPPEDEAEHAPAPPPKRT